MNLHNLGKTIRVKRIHNNLTSGDAANALGISAAAYSRIENGKDRPSQELLTKIAGIYSLPTEDHKLLELLAGYATGAETDSANTGMQLQASTAQPNINVDPQKVPVLFSDSVYVTVSENGVVLDFMQQLASTNQHHVVGRIGVSYVHAQKIHSLLGEQLTKAKNMGIQA